MRKKIIPRSTYPVFVISSWCRGFVLKPEQSSAIEKIYYSSNRVDFISGPRAVGKSVTAYCYALYHAIRNPNSKVCLTADYHSLKRQASNFILSYLYKYTFDDVKNCYILTNGSEVYIDCFSSWDKAGRRYDLSVIDLVFNNHSHKKHIANLVQVSSKTVIVKGYSPA